MPLARSSASRKEGGFSFMQLSARRSNVIKLLVSRRIYGNLPAHGAQEFR